MSYVIFFDWDGTLCTSKISQNANVMRTQFFESQLSEKELVDMMHNENNDHYSYVQEMIANSVGISDETTIKTLQVMFFTYFYLKDAQKNPENILFDKDVFKKFKEKYDLKYVIVTSLYLGNIKGVLELLDLEDLFDGIYANNEKYTLTKEGNLKQAISDFSNDTALFMVGDRGEDVDSGIKNNLETIYCSYGHGSVTYATYNINSFDEIYNIIEKKLFK